VPIRACVLSVNSVRLQDNLDIKKFKMDKRGVQLLGWTLMIGVLLDIDEVNKKLPGT
jgi:hypothetical protein